MSIHIPMTLLIVVGCLAYLLFGGAIGIALTMDGPSQWWIRISARLLIMLLWPLLFVLPLLGAFFS